MTNHDDQNSFDIVSLSRSEYLTKLESLFKNGINGEPPMIEPPIIRFNKRCFYYDWYPIMDYPSYEIHPLGLVRNIKSKRFITLRYKDTPMDTLRWPTVRLYKDGIRKELSVKKLLYYTFFF